ncbi:hypothetical protein [Alteromonas sp. 14N.309.X.WAT.G.H12]|uniref:hypothetical protein n=1 Tax=Alteromonas sp. 14N.309.X.WAT.G.H12 TaxID=3120824 RepID=UPI002FD4ACB7
MTATNDMRIEQNIDVTWKPVSPAFGCKDLAEVIQGNDFRTALANMLADFDKLVPNQVTFEGYEFVGLSEKKALFEKHFPFFQLKVDSQFVSLSPDSHVITCEAALYVLTESGYKPWFTRLGQSSADVVGADGREADAETSALRRIFLALGMGKEGAKEIIEESSKNAISIVNDYCIKNAIALHELVKEYRSHHKAVNLSPLKHNYHDVENGSLGSVIDSADWVSLTEYVSKRSVKNG